MTSTKTIVKDPRPTRVSAKPYPIALLEKALLEISDDPWYNKEEFQRKAIAYVFENSFGFPEELEWHKNTKDYLIQKIKYCLDIPRGTDIEYILHYCIWHKKKGTTYNGERQQRSNVNVGRQALIDVEYIKSHIICDALEDGCSYRLAWSFLAFHSVEEGNAHASL